MVAHSRELKGRPPLRRVPDDFNVIYVEHGHEGCQSWYRAHKRTVSRWLIEAGKERLIKARAAYVKHQRSQGKWLTRATCMIEHREVRPTIAQPVPDLRAVTFTIARHAAQHLRVIRNGGFIVSPTPEGDWWVGSRRLSAAQMVDLAKAKGFVILTTMEQSALQADDGSELERVRYAAHG